jgi:glycosyltransferase involved in cell wall biosynthesis
VDPELRLGQSFLIQSMRDDSIWQVIVDRCSVMPNRPKISFLVPCYNLGIYLPEAVDSIFAQTDQDFEIIIVNDGSTDEETNRILRYFKRPRTTILTTENRGVCEARNLALAHSRGRYVSAFDCDDKLHPRFVERTTSLLDSDLSIAFVST